MTPALGKCVICHDRPAAARCYQCHKPVCRDCSFLTDWGRFCGRDCAATYRRFHGGASLRPHGGHKGLWATLVAFLVVLLLAALAYKLGWIPGLGRP
jgi:hypothetical protein